MLDLDPEKMARLIEDAVSILDPYFNTQDELETWIVSEAYEESDRHQIPEDWPENVPYSFMALVGPRLTDRDVMFDFQANGSRQLREQALGVSEALNTISRQNRLAHQFRPAALAYMTGFTCLYVDAETQPSHKLSDVQRRQLKGRARFIPKPAGAAKDDTIQPAGSPRYESSATPTWPTADMLPRRTFFWDVRARNWSQVRFYGHEVVEDYEDLLARAQAEPDHWDIDAIRRLGRVTQDTNQYQVAARKVSGMADMHQVRYRMVFIPEGKITEEVFNPEEDTKPRKVTREPQEGEYGVWLTLGCADGAGIGRAPGDTGGPGPQSQTIELAKPFYRRGSRRSPYIIFGPHDRTNSTIPFSPLTANKRQIQLWCEMAAAASRRMRRYSRQVIYDLKDETMIEAIRAAQDDDFVGIPGFESGSAQVIERGGMAQQDLAHLGYQQDLVYRNLGLSATLQGSPTNNTATAEGQAIQTGLSRIDDIVEGWEQGLARVGEEMAYHIAFNTSFWVQLDDDSKVRMMLSEVEPFIEAGLLSSEEAERMVADVARQEVHVWQGGDFANDVNLEFGLMRCAVNPQAMKKRSAEEEQAELLGLIPTIAQIGQLVVQQPHFEWIEILRDLGRVFRRPNLHRMLRKDIAQQLSQIEIAMGLRDTTTANIAPGGTRRIGGPGGQTRSFAGNASRSQAAPTAPQPAQRPAAAPQPQQTATL